MTICMSSDDDYISCDSIIPLNNPARDNDESGSKVWKTDREAVKIKSQEVIVSYPVIVSNVGLNRINIQSVTNPNDIACIKLSAIGEEGAATTEFVCFADYKNWSDIGLVDTRATKRAEEIPFSEKMNRVAFITRVKGKTELLLNVLAFSPYSTNPAFYLNISSYSADMNEGIKDDYIKKFISA